MIHLYKWKFLKSKVYSSFLDNFWDADLADVELANIRMTEKSVFLYTFIDLDVEINTKKQNLRLVNMSESQSIKIGSKKCINQITQKKRLQIKH